MKNPVLFTVVMAVVLASCCRQPVWTDVELPLINSDDTVMLAGTLETVTGFTAVIFQHECDHPDGILYADGIAD